LCFFSNSTWFCIATKIKMKVNEIFKSIQGETTFQGTPSLFIRTTGCNFRCNWCDTRYAYDDGTDYTVDEILKIVEKYQYKYVVITGGEPLTQKEVPLLVERLIRDGYTVLVETNGSLDISTLHPDSFKIVDIKCPGSGMSEKMCWQNIDYLTAQDEIKFIIADREDYLWAKSIIESYKLPDRCAVLLSPVFNKLDPKALAGWILADNLSVRLQLQIHKYIWGTDVRGV